MEKLTKNTIKHLFLIGALLSFTTQIKSGEIGTIILAASSIIDKITSAVAAFKTLNIQTTLNLDRSEYNFIGSIPQEIQDYITTNKIDPDATKILDISPTPSSPHLIITGPPGIGKTIAALYATDKTNGVFLRVSAALLQKEDFHFVLRGIQFSSLTFNKISSLTLIIDEIDELGERRFGDRNRENNIALTHLLHLFDFIKEQNLPIRIIATTNRPFDFFDDALLDRFAFKYVMGEPSNEDKISIFKAHVFSLTEREIKALSSAASCSNTDTEIKHLSETLLNKRKSYEILNENLKITLSRLTPRKIRQLVELAFTERTKRLKKDPYSIEDPHLVDILRINPIIRFFLRPSQNFSIRFFQLLLFGKFYEYSGRNATIIALLTQYKFLFPILLKKIPQLGVFLAKATQKSRFSMPLIHAINLLITYYCMKQLTQSSLDMQRTVDLLGKEIWGISPKDIQNILHKFT